MPIMPVPTQTDVVLQSQTTGAVDYLKFVGNQLVSSDMINYGLGPNFKVVGMGEYNGLELVTQNQTTGVVDLLTLDSHGNLIGSTMGTTPLPRIVGEDVGLTEAAGAGTTLVSQLPDGSIDLLGVNASGNLVASQMVAGTSGLPHAVGVGQGDGMNSPMFAGLANNDTLVTQLANGEVDLVALPGPTFGSVTLGGTDLLSSTVGLAPIGDINPNTLIDSNILDPNTNNEGSQFVTMNASGVLDVAYLDAGYGNANAQEGTLYASQSFANSFPGWNVVGGVGYIAHTDVFPIS